MALSPDIIFELFLPFEPTSQQTDEIAGFVQTGLPVPVQTREPVWNSNKNVLSIGYWIDANGFTEDQLKASVRASSFISGTGSMTAGLFVSTAFVQGAANLSWFKQPKKVDESVGYITLDDNIDTNLSSARIVTKVTGSYHPPVLPSVGFTYTISDTLSLNQSPPPALNSNESTDLKLSTLGVIAEAFLVVCSIQFSVTSSFSEDCSERAFLIQTNKGWEPNWRSAGRASS